MSTLKKSPLDIPETKNNYKGAINVEEKMNNPSCEMMPINDYEQTSTSRDQAQIQQPQCHQVFRQSCDKVRHLAASLCIR